MRKSTAVAASIAAVAGIAIGIAGTLALTAEPAPRTAHAPTVDVDACQALAFNLSGGYGGMLATARAGEPIDADTFTRNYTDKAIPLAAECGIDLAY